MGAPSLAQYEFMADRLASLVQADLVGFHSEIAVGARQQLATYIQTFTDPDLQAFLLPTALVADQVSYPENYATALPQILARYATFATVLTQAGLGYGNLAAYLAAVNPTVHPLAAAAMRSALGNQDQAFPAANVFPPQYAALFASRIYYGADGSLTDATTALNGGAGNITLFTTNADTLYIWSDRKFTAVIPGLATLASSTITPTFEYTNGEGWATLPNVTDNGAGFTKNDTIEFPVPSDWTKACVDAGGTANADTIRRYGLRIARTNGTLVTKPIATCVTLVPVPILNGVGLHLDVYQPPIGLFRITGATTQVVTQLLAPDGTRYAPTGVSSGTAGLRLRALTPFGASPNVVLSYTNQANANVTQAQGAWTTPAALATKGATLNGSDTGLKALLSSGAAVSAGGQGVIAVEIAELRALGL